MDTQKELKLAKIDIKNHLKEFPRSVMVEKDDRIWGWWMIGNYYKRKEGYHGEYPPRYLERVYSLFPGFKKVLHLFSGSLKLPQDGVEVTFDANPNVGAHVVGNANELSKYFGKGEFDLIVADPPYSKEDAEKYGYKPNKLKVIRECRKICAKWGHLVWLDTMRPIYSKEDWYLDGMISLDAMTPGYSGDDWYLEGVIPLDCGTNRRARFVTILKAI